MVKTFAKGSPEQKMFKEFYELIQAYYIPEDNDDYWENFVNAADKFAKNNPKIARKLVAAFSKYLEDEYKQEYKNNMKER